MSWDQLITSDSFRRGCWVSLVLCAIAACATRASASCGDHLGSSFAGHSNLTSNSWLPTRQPTIPVRGQECHRRLPAPIPAQTPVAPQTLRQLFVTPEILTVNAAGDPEQQFVEPATKTQIGLRQRLERPPQ
jgi:hypothetical protein